MRINVGVDLSGALRLSLKTVVGEVSGLELARDCRALVLGGLRHPSVPVSFSVRRESPLPRVVSVREMSWEMAGAERAPRGSHVKPAVSVAKYVVWS